MAHSRFWGIRNEAHIPALAFTAHTDKKKLKKIFDAGFDARLSKPLHANKMIVSILSLVGREKFVTRPASTEV